MTNELDEKKQPSGETIEDVKTDLAIVQLILFWAFVGIPLIWGVVQTFHKAMLLFK